jgi:hypothetical protein
MTCTVVWSTAAENQLATLWVRHAGERAALTQAADRIDALLRVDPGTRGWPYAGPTRAVWVPPLAAVYHVSEPDRLVRVLKLWYIPRHTTNGSP